MLACEWVIHKSIRGSGAECPISRNQYLGEGILWFIDFVHQLEKSTVHHDLHSCARWVLTNDSVHESDTVLGKTFDFDATSWRKLIDMNYGNSEHRRALCFCNFCWMCQYFYEYWESHIGKGTIFLIHSINYSYVNFCNYCYFQS